MQVRSQGREHRVSHGWLVDIGRAADKKFYQRRKTSRHRRGGVCPPDNTHVVNHVINRPSVVIHLTIVIHPTIVILSVAKNLACVKRVFTRCFTSLSMTIVLPPLLIVHC